MNSSISFVDELFSFALVIMELCLPTLTDVLDAHAILFIILLVGLLKPIVKKQDLMLKISE